MLNFERCALLGFFDDLNGTRRVYKSKVRAGVGKLHCVDQSRFERIICVLLTEARYTNKQPRAKEYGIKQKS